MSDDRYLIAKWPGEQFSPEWDKVEVPPELHFEMFRCTRDIGSTGGRIPVVRGVYCIYANMRSGTLGQHYDPLEAQCWVYDYLERYKCTTPPT